MCLCLRLAAEALNLVESKPTACPLRCHLAERETGTGWRATRHVEQTGGRGRPDVARLALQPVHHGVLLVLFDAGQKSQQCHRRVATAFAGRTAC